MSDCHPVDQSTSCYKATARPTSAHPCRCIQTETVNPGDRIRSLRVELSRLVAFRQIRDTREEGAPDQLNGTNSVEVLASKAAADILARYWLLRPPVNDRAKAKYTSSRRCESVGSISERAASAALRSSASECVLSREEPCVSS